MIRNNIKKERPIKRLLLFNLVAVVVALVIGLIVFLIFYDEFLPYVQIMFSDFAQIMQFALVKNPYLIDSGGSSYPPLAILILYFPYALISRNVIHFGSIDILKTSEFWISFALFYAVFFVAAALLLKKLIGLKGKSFACFFLMVLSSGMILYMIARGNIIISALVFLLFFLAFYKSEKKILRELALVALALAGAIKIYPLIFGVLLLKDKRIFASARVAAYTFALFFLPFLFFDGGFSNIQLFINNLSSFSLDNERLLYILNMSSAGLVHKIFNAVGWLFGVSLTVAAKIVSAVITALIAVAAVVGSLLSKSRFSLFVICTIVMILIPSVSYYYAAVFMIVPLTEFLKEYENVAAGRKTFYLIFFMSLICSVCFLVCGILTPLLIAALIYETVRNIKNYYKGKQGVVFQGALV